MATKKRAPKKPEPLAAPVKMRAKDKLDAKGIDWVCEQILSTRTMTDIARELDINIAGLIVWINADENRSARAQEARTRTALLWDEKAVTTIEEADGPIELAKARELAHHYRWRAAKIAPKTYGDKQEVIHSGQVDIANALAAARRRISGSSD